MRLDYKMTKVNALKYIKITFKLLGKFVLLIAHLEIKLVRWMFSESRKVGIATKRAFYQDDDY